MKKILFFIILIFGLKLFDLNIVNTTIANGLAVVSFIIILYGIIIKRTNRTSYKFKSLIYLFYFGLFINFIMMYFYNNSSLYDSTFILINYSGLLFYFFLHKYNYSEKMTIKLVFIIAIIVSFLMIIQQIVKPTPLFNQLIFHSNYLDQRGTVRVRIPGMALVVFSYFLYLFKYIKTRKLINIIFSLFFAAVIILQGFRSITLSLFLCSMFLYWYGTDARVKISIKKIFSFSILAIGVVLIFLQIDYVRNIIEKMFLQVEADKKIGDGNVRIFAFVYYLVVIKNELWMYFTGNGLKIPHKTPEGLFAVDLGIFGFFALAGFIPTYALIKSFIKGILMSKRIKYIIPSTFLLYILINSFLFNAEAFRTGIFHIYAIAFYLIELRMYKFNSKTIELT